MQAVFTRKNGGLSCLYDRKFQQSYTISVMVQLVLINAAANHIARSDRCLPNRELANIFQTLALTSRFTLQTVLSKWQTNSLVILSRNTRNTARIIIREVIKNPSSPAVFSKLRAFVI